MTDPAPAAVTETLDVDTISIEYDGRSWTFPASPDHLRYSQLTAFEGGKLTEFLPSVLPPEQMKLIVDEDRTMGWLKGLSDCWADAAGFKKGE